MVREAPYSSSEKVVVAWNESPTRIHLVRLLFLRELLRRNIVRCGMVAGYSVSGTRTAASLVNAIFTFSLHFQWVLCSTTLRGCTSAAMKVEDLPNLISVLYLLQH